MTPKRVWTRRTLSHRYRTKLTPTQVEALLDTWLTSGHWLIANRLWNWVVVGRDVTQRSVRLDSRVPGTGAVLFRWTDGDQSRVTCQLRFDPYGPIGLGYWLILWPGHWVGVWILLRSILRPRG